MGYIKSLECINLNICGLGKHNNEFAEFANWEQLQLIFVTETHETTPQTYTRVLNGLQK